MIKQICLWWKSVLIARKLRRALPQIAQRKQKIAALRMSHKSTRLVIAEQRRDIHSALRSK